MVDLAQNVITVAQALNLYTTFLNEQIRLTPPAFRNRAVLVVTRPEGGLVSLSYPQMLSEVQRQTALGIDQAILHARARGYAV